LPVFFLFSPTGIARADPGVAARDAAARLAPSRPLLGRGVARIQPPGLTRVGWGPGEQLTYAVKLASIEGARAAISIGKPATSGGRRTLVLRAMGETVPFISTIRRMREENITQVDLAGLLPVRSNQDRQIPDNTRKLETTFGPLTRMAINWAGRPGIDQRQRRLPWPHFDPLAAFCLLRSAPLPPAGVRFTIHVLTGMTLYRATLEVKGRERVYTPKRQYTAWRIDGTAQAIGDNGAALPHEPPRALSLWITADKLRLPVRIQGESKIGYVEATLTSHRPARTELLVRPTPLF
jgi:hypothetical protein